MSREEQLDYMTVQRRILERAMAERYKPSFMSQLSDFFQSLGEFILVIIAIPFLTLIKIFEIIFNRK